ncbi:hypothetical protein QO002_000913 [Pararhizobium capsulatum DSM 1112]|uniref:Uncharacterized protein n=1 Tax=Pararhizobium capsulatum DSM 1112 TaxID=1121113 RepID=A0ABU0BKK1_9HYPH|nr:hypothetical protein [Pararhizobium capsulatum]MDQ0318775.1 hypothetical protein [Pararhizobium capsulatum DSM 1112]
MATRKAAIKQSDATRLLKAAKAAGFERARFSTTMDGGIVFDVFGGGEPDTSATEAATSPFEKWKTENANKAKRN